MSIKTTLEWEKVSEQGLPIIGNIHQTVLFIYDGEIFEGFPVGEDYYYDAGLEEPEPEDWDWEDLNGTMDCQGVEYWAYIPDKLKKLVE